MIINSKKAYFFWLFFNFGVLLQSMKKLFVVISCLISVLCAGAQERSALQSKVEPLSTESVDAEEPQYRNGMMPVSDYNVEMPSYADSLHLPELDYNGRVPNMRSWYSPYYGYGFGGWELHSGLNVNLGVSAFTSFGKHAFSGWSQNISLMYAMPVNDKLSVALGGYINNISSGIGGYREGALSAVLDYRFNEHWEAFLYAQKSILNNNNLTFSRGMYPMYMMGSPFWDGGDRIGGGVRYHFKNDTFVQFQFEYQKLPDFHQNIEQRWQHPDQK